MNRRDGNVSSAHENVEVSHLTWFWSILPFYVLSMICTVFDLYYFIGNRALRRALHNHVIVIILLLNLFIQLTNTAWSLNYHRLGYVWPQSPVFCEIWTLIDEGSHIAITIFFAWATVERHILIFHDRFVATKRGIFFFHYTPKLLIASYCIGYCCVVVLFPPCENVYDYDKLVCGDALCFYELQSVTNWDVIVNDSIPMTMIVVFSVGLLLRIFGQKTRMHQRIRWRNYRKMALQLLSISSLYLIIYVPHILIQLVESWGSSSIFSGSFVIYADFSLHYGYFLLPFVCASSIPELRLKLERMVPYWRRQSRTVAPHQFTISHRAAEREMRPLDVRAYPSHPRL